MTARCRHFAKDATKVSAGIELDIESDERLCNGIDWMTPFGNLAEKTSPNFGLSVEVSPQVKWRAEIILEGMFKFRYDGLLDSLEPMEERKSESEEGNRLPGSVHSR